MEGSQMSEKIRATYLGRLNNKLFYFSALVLLAVAASGLFLLSDSTIVSAQKGDLASRGENKGKLARADQLAFALRFGTSGEYTVFGAKGIRGNGATIEGKSGTGSDEASLGENGSGLKARSDLNKALSMIKQLPCQDTNAVLTGGTFAPGVYCAPSAALAGQMVLDAGGDETGSFVFRIDGAMKSVDNFQMSLENGAKPGNVYFIADTASLGAFNSVIGTVIARGMVDVGAGTSLKGRAFSKESEVILADGANLALADAYIQICKAAFSPEDLADSQDSLRYKIFQFQINSGTIIEVPTGQCSAPILVTDGNNTIQELLNGFYINRDRNAPGGTWFNRFRLVGVSLSGNVPANGGAGAFVGTPNLETRTATVSVPPSANTNPLIVTFTNTFAISGVIEICKYPSQLTQTGAATVGPPTNVGVNDTAVSGFFDFTVDAIPNRIFTIPVGVCTGPIQVLTRTIPAPPAAPALVLVTEIAEPGFTLESVSTNPTDRLQNVVLNFGIRNTPECSNIGPGVIPPGCIFNNSGGGWADVILREGSTPSNQVLINFFNRTNPGIIKICKIAGPGIPLGTRFVFEVRGRQAQFQATGSGNLILPGADVIRYVTINAGPPEQGGNCAIVTEPGPTQIFNLKESEAGLAMAPGDNTLFVVGTLAYVREVAVLDDVPLVEHNGFGDVDVHTNDGVDTTPDSEVRVSRIRLNGSLTGFPAGPQTVQGFTVDPNPNLLTREAIFRVNRGETVVEYTNYLFRPTVLKICKIAGPNITVGTLFTFGVTIDNFGGLLPGQTNQPITVPNVTVAAGPASQGGFCAFAQGPFGLTPGNPGTGTFPVGATVSVTELPQAGTTVTSIVSGTGTVGPCTPGNPRCGSLVLGYPGGVNEIAFTNRGNPPGDPSGLPRQLSGNIDSACPGITNAAQTSVFIASLGDEVSANFTVQFDPAKLSNPDVQIGAGALAAGWVLNVNYANQATGQLGITLTSPGNTPLTAGTRELIKIEFDTVNLASGEALITFGGPTQTVTTDQLNEVPTEPGQASVTIGGPNVPGCTTSAGVTVSGRVLSADGAGLRNASVTITDQAGNRRTVTTSSLGYYTIEDVNPGETYVIGASSRRYRFNSRVLQISDSLTEVDFIGME